VNTTTSEIHGDVDDGFGPVADVFARNFAEREELGAACCVYVDGVRRVDLWGGVADEASGRPWDEDTLQLVFSATKGIVATCIARLVDDGRLRYDDRVADHWPEFAAAGKGDVTVAELLSHRAGLIAVEDPLDFDQLMDPELVASSLARQAPMWEPGTAVGYHAITFGWLAGELLARVDGRRIGRYLADEVTGPLGAEFWIGLPESEEHRVTTLASSAPPTDPELLDRLARMYRRDANGYRSITLDGRLRTRPENHFDGRAVHATEMPGANGITNARSLARIYAATIGPVDGDDGVRLLSGEAMDAARTELASTDDDLTLLVPTRFGAGFWLHGSASPMIQDGSFGHPGMGGSLGFANPELGIGFGYVMNRMGNGVTSDPRSIALADAVLQSLT
jgi:CubicO group peptidase (beta-lactamase class C family)